MAGLSMSKPRLYQSPSSVKMGDNASPSGCELAYAYRYVAGLREPEVAWRDIRTGVIEVAPWGVRPADGQCTPGQRSKALGVALHRFMQRWALGKRVRWTSLIGQIAASGIHLCPPPGGEQLLETALGDHPLPPSRHKDAPTHGLLIDRMVWVGLLDRLVKVGGLWLLIDYKSSADLKKYVPTPEALAVDLAACLYVVGVCRRLGLSRLACRWIYFETKKVRRAVAVDFSITLKDALRVVRSYGETARHLTTIRAVDQATPNPNPEACDAYGGCYYARKLGGPCTVRRSFSQLIQLHQKKDPQMAVTEEELNARFAAASGKAAPAKSAKAEPDEEPAPAKRARKAKAAPEPAPEPMVGSLAETLTELASELAEAEAAVEAIKSRIVEACA
jgi:hypothetical protein